MIVNQYNPNNPKTQQPNTQAKTKTQTKTQQANTQTETQQADNDDEEDGLAEFLSFCDAAEAPLGKYVRRFIFEHLSKEEGTAVFGDIDI